MALARTCLRATALPLSEVHRPPCAFATAHKCQTRQRLPPSRVTNTGEEIYKAQNLSLEALQKKVELNKVQVLSPELGPLEARVGKFYLDELIESTGPDLEETAYWFHTPEGGWNTEPVRMDPAEEAPVTFPEPLHIDDMDGRVLFDDLQEGIEVVGVITDMWLYHGIQVDIGAEYDGVVVMEEQHWMQDGVRQALMPGETVAVKIYSLRRPGLYRWPVQLELLEPSEIAAKLPNPGAFIPPINHNWCTEQGWQIEDICEATGRTYKPTEYYIDTDHEDYVDEIRQAYGWENPDACVPERNPDEVFVDEHEEHLASLASGLFSGGSS